MLVAKGDSKKKGVEFEDDKEAMEGSQEDSELEAVTMEKYVNFKEIEEDSETQLEIIQMMTQTVVSHANPMLER